MNGSYDHLQVALSVLLAVAASYAALDLAGRVTAARGRMRVAWLSGGALVMGIGIWSMHYVGVLAFQLPVVVRYHWPTVLLSLIAGIACSAFALIAVSWRKMRLAYALAGSLFMGGGIVALHYIGITAMRLAARSQFDRFLVGLSVALAVIFSLIALWLAFYFRSEPHNALLRKAASAVIMGAAISAMHYTAMAAVTFVPTMVNPEFTHAVSISSLGTTGIGAVTLILLGLAMLTCSIDRRFAARKLELALAESKLELARVNRIATVGELTASIAHEINQPLTAIVMSASAALDWISLEPPHLAEARQTLAKSILEANRASAVIARIRALLAKAAPEIRTLNMNDVAREVLSLTSGELVKRGITVKAELTAELPPVRGDRVQLQQVMLNLVLNAIEAMDSNSNHARELIIKSEKDTDGILIQIIDSGTGLDREQAEHIFQPFFTTKPQGLGMGLAISRSIIEAHGGHLSARRRNSHGAIFEVRLPAEDMK
jgi:two-component system sensor histidine kinase/response regulator